MNPSDIITLADSYGTGYTPGGQHNGWPQMLGIPPENIMARDGTTAAQVAALIASGAAESEADKIRGKTVILTIGGNDLFLPAGPLPLFFDIARNLHTVMQAIKPVAGRVIVLTYPNPIRFPDDPRYAAAGPTVTCLNFLLGYQAKQNGFDIIDLDGLLADSDFTPGDIHPNPSGHAKIAEAVKKEIERKEPAQ